MNEIVSELQQIYGELLKQAENLKDPEITAPLDALEKSATEVEKAWGHSWFWISVTCVLRRA
jgi:hypothetical protein